MGRNHARVLSRNENFEVVGVFDPFQEALIRDFGLSSIEELSSFLSVNELDYAVIATPTSLHRELAEVLAASHIPTLVEKPLAGTVAEATSIERAFEATSTPCFVGHVERFNPALMALSEKVSAGVLGNIFQISTFRHGPFTSRISDVGVGFDLLSHDVDTVLWTTQQKYSKLLGVAKVHSSGLHEDALEAIGSLESGITVTHSTNRVSPSKRRQTFVWGDNGMLLADSLKSELVLFANGEYQQPTNLDPATIFRGMTVGDATTFALSHTEPLAGEHLAIRHFLQTGDVGKLATGSQGLEVVRVVEELLSSIDN
jgi:predicted dehydrogenase